MLRGLHSKLPIDRIATWKCVLLLCSHEFLKDLHLGIHSYKCGWRRGVLVGSATLSPLSTNLKPPPRPYQISQRALRCHVLLTELTGWWLPESGKGINKPINFGTHRYLNGAINVPLLIKMSYLFYDLTNACDIIRHTSPFFCIKLLKLQPHRSACRDST